MRGDFSNGTGVWKCRACQDDSDDEIVFLGVANPATVAPPVALREKMVMGPPSQPNRQQQALRKRATSPSSDASLLVPPKRQKALSPNQTQNGVLEQSSGSLQPFSPQASVQNTAASKTHAIGPSIDSPSSSQTQSIQVPSITISDTEPHTQDKSDADDDPDELYRYPTPGTSRANIMLLEARARATGYPMQRLSGATPRPTPRPSPLAQTVMFSDDVVSVVTSEGDDNPQAVPVISDKLATWWVEEKHKKEWEKVRSQQRRAANRHKHLPKLTTFDAGYWFSDNAIQR